ncbi:hypothetical protein, partial [Massilia timonae]|uniref:hypothetical protein n=1 Tax=Massilia timonae TaxID=47229 RepID=UPI002898A343
SFRDYFMTPFHTEILTGSFHGANDSMRGQLKYMPALEPPARTTSSTNDTQLFGKTSHRHGFASSSSSFRCAPSGFGIGTMKRLSSCLSFSLKYRPYPVRLMRFG